LRGGGGWANTKKKFAHRKNPEKNIVHNKPIEKELGVIFKIIMPPPRRRTFRRTFRENVFRSSKKNIVQRNVAEKKFLQAIGG
jgi:hypothetical protein